LFALSTQGRKVKETSHVETGYNLLALL